MLAPKNDNNILAEKPVRLCYRNLNATIAPESTAKPKAFVGYQPTYTEALLDEVAEVNWSTRFSTFASETFQVSEALDSV
jgi:hypothetical protein